MIATTRPADRERGATVGSGEHDLRMDEDVVYGRTLDADHDPSVV